MDTRLRTERTSAPCAGRPPINTAGSRERPDDFLDEGSIEVLHGKTFVQVTAIVAPGGDTARVSKAVLRGLAKQALERAK
jgi:hypothetical protein